MHVPVMQSLRSYLQAGNTTGTSFAERVGASQGTVSRWVSGKSAPRKSALKKIADETGMDAVFLPGRGVFLIQMTPAQ